MKLEAICKNCGAILKGVICEYCGMESNYIFLSHDEIKDIGGDKNFIRLADNDIGASVLIFSDHTGDKEIVLRSE